MQAPFVCLVVAHGWNIIKEFPVAAHWCGWWWVQTRCWVLGEQAPAALSCCCCTCLCVVVVRWGGGCLCVSLAGPSHGSRCGGVCGWVSGCGSWFFHSGREHLDIAAVPVCGGGCGVLCDFCFECFLCYPTRAALLLLWWGVV